MLALKLYFCVSSSEKVVLMKKYSICKLKSSEACGIQLIYKFWEVSKNSSKKTLNELLL